MAPNIFERGTDAGIRDAVVTGAVTAPEPPERVN
jgi:hypothetical protein